MTITNWELARYLIDAKKCVDSIMFIARHKKSLSNINIRKKIHDIQQEFYIKCCVVVDNALSSKERGRLKDENYVKQLNGYKDYIKDISNKNVYIYLYSIIDETMNQII